MRDSMKLPGARFLIVERARLLMRVKYGARIYLPPYMEVRIGSRLVVTISVSQRMGRPPFFLAKPPGDLSVGVMAGEVGDTESTAKHIRSVQELAGVSTDDDGEPR
ncbi:hypothetical protein AB0M95_01450 [Sphaerisporangium sp. NPDC051017]|uniref:hypothetical protein n=1 Tax=Sphaerisporangium sp. NPDC051017 TaxID=3154636 RepID=UPI00341C1DBE